MSRLKITTAPAQQTATTSYTDVNDGSSSAYGNFQNVVVWPCAAVSYFLAY